MHCNSIKKEEDNLKDITEIEIEVIVMLNMMEDRLWNLTPRRLETANETVEQQVEIWKSYINAVNTDECWKDGNHCGDCTKVPMTCFRCMCENRLKNARKFLEWFNGPYNNNLDFNK